MGLIIAHVGQVQKNTQRSDGCIDSMQMDGWMTDGIKIDDQ